MKATYATKSWKEDEKKYNEAMKEYNEAYKLLLESRTNADYDHANELVWDAQVKIKRALEGLLLSVTISMDCQSATL